MRNLYNEIYTAINEGIYKALLIDPEQDNEQVKYSHHKISNQVLFNFIDLGLPSGTLWCEHNLGATCENNPESWYGDYYAWGEVTTKTIYDGFCYDCEDYDKKIERKYNRKSMIELQNKDDVVYNEYKKIYTSYIIHMPTSEQIQELTKNTDYEWIENYNGIEKLNGLVFTGKNRNSIFIPAAGCYHNSEYIGMSQNGGFEGYLWSKNREPHRGYAYSLYFYRDKIINGISSQECFSGLPVRGVYKK